MTLKTKLRIPSTLPLLNPAIKARLLKELGDCDERFYELLPDRRKSYQKRMTSLHQAFLHLLDNVPANNAALSTTELKNYADFYYNYDALADKGRDKSDLARFKSFLTMAIQNHWQLEKPEAVELFDRAEAFYLISQGRPNIATIVPATDGVYVLVNEILTSCPKESISDLRVIKNSDCPISPPWFQALSPLEKKILHISNFTGDNLLLNVNLMIVKWNLIKKNESKQLAFDLQNILQGTASEIEWFTSLEPSLQAELQLYLKMGKESDLSARIDKQLRCVKKCVTSLKKNHYEDLLILKKSPFWYLLLSTPTQQLLYKELIRHKAVESLPAVSAKLRCLPVVSNFARHRLLKINAHGECTTLSEQYRSSHAAPRDIMDGFSEIYDLYTRRNLEHIVDTFLSHYPDKLEFMLSMLLSPINTIPLAQSLINSWYPLPDTHLYNQLQKSFPLVQEQSRIDLHQINTPLNSALYIEPVDKGYAKFMTHFARFRQLGREKINALCDDFEYYMSSTIPSIHNNLCLSTMVTLLMQEIQGGACTQCVSGKDRTAIHELHTAAYRIYYDQYARWPDQYDPNVRTIFVDIFAALYLSNHEHMCASQNAPGAEGVQNASEYIPYDLRLAIEAKNNSAFKSLTPTDAEPTSLRLKEDSHLASTNEIKDFKDYNLDFKPKDENFNFYVKILKVDALVADKIIGLLTDICRNEMFWRQLKNSYNFFATGFPNGIDGIKAILSNDSMHSVEKLAHCLIRLKDKITANGSRHALTENFYQIMSRCQDSDKALPLLTDLQKFQDTTILPTLACEKSAAGI